MNVSERAATALKHLPPFPPVAAKALALLNDESVCFRQVGEVLKTDAALMAEVLRLANSPLVAVRNPVNNVLQALSLLGVRRVSGLLLTLGMSRLLRKAGAGLTVRRSWNHNLATALAAMQFAQAFGRDKDESYNAGLFHDVGKLAFAVIEPRFYETAAGAIDLRELERETFGLDHCEAGAWFVRAWNLPSVFEEVTLHHHNPGPEASNLVMLVNASCVVANRLGYSVVESACAETNVIVTDDLSSYVTGTIRSLELQFGL